MSPVPAAGQPAHDGLARRLGVGDAVVLGSMLGACVYAAFGPAAAAAGSGLLIALIFAGLVVEHAHYRQHRPQPEPADSSP